MASFDKCLAMIDLTSSLRSKYDIVINEGVVNEGVVILMFNIYIIWMFNIYIIYKRQVFKPIERGSLSRLNGGL